MYIVLKPATYVHILIKLLISLLKWQLKSQSFTVYRWKIGQAKSFNFYKKKDFCRVKKIICDFCAISEKIFFFYKSCKP